MNKSKEDLEKLTRAVYDSTGHMQSFYDVYAAVKEMIEENDIKQIDCPEFLKFLKMAFTAGFVQCAVDTQGLLEEQSEAKNERN